MCQVNGDDVLSNEGGQRVDDLNGEKRKKKKKKNKKKKAGKTAEEEAGPSQANGHNAKSNYAAADNVFDKTSSTVGCVDG